MTQENDISALKRGWTTGACATAAVRAALCELWGDKRLDRVSVRLPKGEMPEFEIAHRMRGDDWVEIGIIKDAGSDPDVTHGALIIARVSQGAEGVEFRAGEGVGTVTRPGLPVAVGEPAINPVPRQMMTDEVHAAAAEFDRAPDVLIQISVPGGEEIATKTWNPRLGIVGGLSILGTTGIVRPFSCAAWIASIHRGIDVARAEGLDHVAGATGSTSEGAVKAHYGLPDHALLDMGDFAGGMLKYLVKNPVSRVSICGGIGKMTKLAQGAVDLHSARSQVDFCRLAADYGDDRLADCGTMLQALDLFGADLARWVADRALAQVNDRFNSPEICYDVLVINREGKILGQAGA